MSPIAFIDTEISPHSQKVLAIGSVKADGAQFHKPFMDDFAGFLAGIRFICGHNILNHDIKYIGPALARAGLTADHVIDTLFLSPLLFPRRPYHALLKDDKLQSEELNNPLNDAIKARDLFFDEVAAFNKLEDRLQQIFYLLLRDKREFAVFFRYLGYSCPETDMAELIVHTFQEKICSNARLTALIGEHPIELAYSLSLINVHDRCSITPPWVLRNYPEVERVMYLLRNKSCVSGCVYCDEALDIRKGLMRFFGFDSFRTYDEVPLQQDAVQAAVDNKSLLVVFPTGGGKSITFQLPALMSGASVKGLTVVISPLQSLMKDQVDNLEDKGITDAVTINGLLSSLERADAFERVENGTASLLYISPETLRSKSIERLLLGRKIVRFVIDEAHCFSAWGQDFRVDYLYIGEFIKSLQQQKGLEEGIPVSCFTATAKRQVIADIRDYFKKKLSIDMVLFAANPVRTNLHYRIFLKNSEEEKYLTVRDWIEQKKCPTIIYVSRTKKAAELADRLTRDGFNAKPYHGKMEVNDKTANQTAFITGEVQIMVATSAFGMGVDKKDVGLVIHFEISDSLENYIQEAGRAGRDERIEADCYVLYNEDDLSKHFTLLNQTRLSIKEVQQIWKAIKEVTRFRSTASNSALEIARMAGWDDNILEIETRVKTAIAALENAGYVKRKQNMPRVFANSILARNAQEAVDKIQASEKFDEKEKQVAIQIIKKLISSRSRKHIGGESPEFRIDYISDHLGIKKEKVIYLIQLLREENILADARDLTAFLKRSDSKNRSLGIVENYGKIEQYLISELNEGEQIFHIKELNELAESRGLAHVTPYKIKTLFNFWAIRDWLIRKPVAYRPNHIVVVCKEPKDSLKGKMEKRHELAKFIVDFLFERSMSNMPREARDEVLVEFSVHELRIAYENSGRLFTDPVTIRDIEDALFYLSRIDAIKLEGDFMVVYNQMTIERIEQDNKKRYTKTDYETLSQFYENKVQQIHIVGEYARIMIEDYKGALQFTEDYFQLNYSSFLGKYFPGSKVDNLKLRLTPGKFKQLFGDLSPAQLRIIKDNQTKYIVVAAGPGSGKTKILVHKLAALLLMEDIRHEQLLMLTFSRAAATELKKRLTKLIGGAANYIDIKTFHSYCFDLLGRIGSLDKVDNIIETAIQRIGDKEVELSRITKTVLVIDEAQDMDKLEFELVKTLMHSNEDMRIIAVGDDDQNIYEFRDSSAEHLKQLVDTYGASKYELVENYRSRPNLVNFTNQFVEKISHRLKELPIVSTQKLNGQIKIVHYRSRHLILPLIHDILHTDLIGTTCVLTEKNSEALQVTGLLIKAGQHAKLIQANDGFDLGCMAELRYFTEQLVLREDTVLIDEELWLKATQALANKYKESARLDVCMRLIQDFHATHPGRKYKSDFMIFVKESKLEDFYEEQGEVIFVSTIHKAKGKEFDNIFLLLQNELPETDENKRKLYVAMTRARVNLTIHLNGGYLDDLNAGSLIRVEDATLYAAPTQIIIPLTHSDIHLGYGKFVEHLVADLHCGSHLGLTEEGCINTEGKLVLKFSKSFKQGTMARYVSGGYKPVRAAVNFLVYWKDRDTETESLIALPILYLEQQAANK